MQGIQETWGLKQTTVCKTSEINLFSLDYVWEESFACAPKHKLNPRLGHTEPAKKQRQAAQGREVHREETRAEGTRGAGQEGAKSRWRGTTPSTVCFQIIIE